MLAAVSNAAFPPAERPVCQALERSSSQWITSARTPLLIVSSGDLAGGGITTLSGTRSYSGNMFLYTCRMPVLNPAPMPCTQLTIVPPRST